MNATPKAWPTTPAVNAQTLPAFLAAHALTVVHFWAEWNHWDVLQSTELDSVRSRYSSRIAFVSFDVDTLTEWPSAKSEFPYNIVKGPPTLLYFVRGELFETCLGFQKEAQIEAVCERMLHA